MEKKNSCARAGFSTILWGVVTILLCAAPCGARTVASGETLNVGTGYPDEQILNDWLDVYGTVNLYAGAYVDWGLYAYAGSIVNIYAGEVGAGYSIVVFTFANVTIYGVNFTLDGNPVSAGELILPGGYGTLTGTYAGGSDIYLLIYSDVSILLVDTGGPQEVQIDIKPGSYPNSINLGSKGVIPVAILSDADFDATIVDPATVELAGSGVAMRGKGNKAMAHEEDVNGDGLTDLVVKVETENLDPGTFQDGKAIVTIVDENGVVEFQGSDEITIVPPEG